MSELITPQHLETRKVAIIGTGFVGSSFAYALMIQGTVSEIILVDIDTKRAEGEAMDLNHGLPFVQPTRIRAGGYSDCKDADIIVITAGLARKPGESRLDLVAKNAEIFQQIVPNIQKYAKDSILLVATNPVDVMTYATLKLSEFPPTRVIGAGTILDTARFRSLLGHHHKVDPRNVHAYIIGEHGDSELPVFSLATIAGLPLKTYCEIFDEAYDRDHLQNIFEQVKTAGKKIIGLKGRTNYAIGLGLVRIVQSILRDENAILTVSSLLPDYFGVRDVCLSVPTILNRTGIREVVPLPLDEEELQMFQKSASIVKEAIQSLNL